MGKFEWACPYLEARSVNRYIAKNQKNKPEDLEKEWLAKLQKTDLEEHTLERISRDIYQSQERRILSIENKAMSLIIAIGFSILLLSIFIAFYDDNSRSIIRLVVLLILIPAITNLFLAGMAAIKASRISRRYVVSSYDLKDILSLQNDKILQLVARHLTNLEINESLETIKGNWADAAQTHIKNGLVYVAVATGMIITDLLVLILLGWHSLSTTQFFDNLFGFFTQG